MVVLKKVRFLFLVMPKNLFCLNSLLSLLGGEVLGYIDLKYSITKFLTTTLTRIRERGASTLR